MNGWDQDRFERLERVAASAACRVDQLERRGVETVTKSQARLWVIVLSLLWLASAVAWHFLKL